MILDVTQKFKKLQSPGTKKKGAWEYETAQRFFLKKDSSNLSVDKI